MPFLLIVIGLMLTITSAKNRQGDLLTLAQSDFTGQGNFIYWFISIIIIGSIGYIKPLRPLSNAFLVLLIVVLLLSSKGGFFVQFQQQVATLTNATPKPIADTQNAGVTVDYPTNVTQTSGSGGGGLIGGILGGIGSFFGF